MIPISEELEHGLVSGVVRGLVPLETVPCGSLSKNGQAVCTAVEFLRSKGAKSPYAKNSVLAAAADAAGADKVILRPYLEAAMKVAGGDADVLGILQKVHEQNALVAVMEAASKQLADRSFDPVALKKALNRAGSYKLVPASALIKDGKFPDIPTGYTIPSLPMLTRASGGVMGVWAIGGKAKMGKSTLGLQVALDMPVPVLYYDMENGEEVMMHRIGKIYDGDVEKAKRRLDTFYIKRRIQTLDMDLLQQPAPAVIVIDSIQKLPTKADQRRNGIDGWLAKFEALKEDGYTTILISEVNGFGGYKETGEIEYTVDFGMQLRRYGTDIVASVVANRHRAHYGDLCVIERVNDWRVVEGDGAQEDDNQGGL